jgi:hypothetical protein
MNSTTLFTFTAVAALTLAACDSKQENRREDALEQKADALENKADAVENATEKRADALENRSGGDAAGEAVRAHGRMPPTLWRTKPKRPAKRSSSSDARSKFGVLPKDGQDSTLCRRCWRWRRCRSWSESWEGGIRRSR